MFDCKLPFRISRRPALENTPLSLKKLASCLFVTKNAARTPPALSKYFHTAALSLANTERGKFDCDVATLQLKVLSQSAGLCARL